MFRIWLIFTFVFILSSFHVDGSEVEQLTIEINKAISFASLISSNSKTRFPFLAKIMNVVIENFHRINSYNKANKVAKRLLSLVHSSVSSLKNDNLLLGLNITNKRLISSTEGIYMDNKKFIHNILNNRKYFQSIKQPGIYKLFENINRLIITLENIENFKVSLISETNN